MPTPATKYGIPAMDRPEADPTAFRAEGLPPAAGEPLPSKADPYLLPLPDDLPVAPKGPFARQEEARPSPRL